MEETKEGGSDDGEGMDMSDDDVPTSKHEGTTPATPLGSVVNGDVLKRKREMDDDPSIVYAEDGTPCKRFKSESPPPAPPPPPPADGLTPDDQSPLELPYNDGQVVEGQLDRTISSLPWRGRCHNRAKSHHSKSPCPIRSSLLRLLHRALRRKLQTIRATFSKV